MTRTLCTVLLVLAAGSVQAMSMQECTGSGGSLGLLPDGRVVCVGGSSGMPEGTADALGVIPLPGFTESTTVEGEFTPEFRQYARQYGINAAFREAAGRARGSQPPKQSCRPPNVVNTETGVCEPPPNPCGDTQSNILGTLATKSASPECSDGAGGAGGNGTATSPPDRQASPAQLPYYLQPNSTACMMGALGNPERFFKVAASAVGTYGVGSIRIASSTGYGTLPLGQVAGWWAGGMFGRALGLNVAATVESGGVVGVGVTGTAGLAAAGMAGWAMGSAFYCYVLQ